MLSNYTENELWAHINHMRAIHWAAKNEDTFEIICGIRGATRGEREALARKLASDGLGELQVVVLSQYIEQIHKEDDY